MRDAYDLPDQNLDDPRLWTEEDEAQEDEDCHCPTCSQGDEAWS